MGLGVARGNKARASVARALPEHRVADDSRRCEEVCLTQVCVAARGRELAVSEEFSDHLQRPAQIDERRGERMPE